MTLALLQEEPRIVLQAGIHHDGLHAIGQADCQRGDGQGVAEHLRQGRLVVIGLEGVGIALAATVVVDVGHKGLIVGGKAKFHGFIVHHEGFVVAADEAIGRTVVIGSDLDGELLCRIEQQLSVFIADGLLLIKRVLEAAIDALLRHLADLTKTERLLALRQTDVDS